MPDAMAHDRSNFLAEEAIPRIDEEHESTEPLCMARSYDTHLYVIMWPNYALVGSNLPPEEFGKHYTLGSSRYFHGQVVFAEIEPSYRHPELKIDKFIDEVKPNAAGHPKRTKFFCTYRVLEHVDLSAFQKLYITSTMGKELEIESAPYEKEHDSGYLRTFQELTPMRAIALSWMTPPEFGKYITDAEQPKSAPKVLFTQIDFDIENFLSRLETDPFHKSPIPNVHPHKLREQILEVRGNPNKRVKGISLDAAFGQMAFTKLRTGFWIANGNKLLFYPIPSIEDLKEKHWEWYKSLD